MKMPWASSLPTHRRTPNVITFISIGDLCKLPPTDPAFLVVEELLDLLISGYTRKGHHALRSNWNPVNLGIQINYATLFLGGGDNS